MNAASKANFMKGGLSPHQKKLHYMFEKRTRYRILEPKLLHTTYKALSGATARMGTWGR